MASSLAMKSIRWLVAALLAVALGPAQAGAFVTRWDPQFNLSFTNNFGALGWSGEAVVTVDDACVAQNGTSLVFPWGSCPSANLDSLDLTLYQFNGVGNPPGAPLVPTFHLVDPNTNVLAVESTAGVVSGIFTFPALKFDDVQLFGKEFDFWLLFTTDGPYLAAKQDCYGSSKGSWMSCDRQIYISGNPNNPKDPTAPTVTWARVPEPGSLALLGLALGAMGFVQRGRRKVAA